MTDKSVEKLLDMMNKRGANYCQVVTNQDQPSTVTTTASADNYQYLGHDPYIKEFNLDKVVEERLAKIKHLMLIKSKEYVRDDNPFHNFDKGAEYTGETPEDYLYGLMTKHLVSIKDMVDDLYEGKEPSIKYLEEKIGDALLYLMLLEGLFKRRIL